MGKNSEPKMASEEWKWKVEDAARTLTRAEEIRADAKLLAAAKKEMQKQQKAIAAALKKQKVSISTALMNT